MDIGNISAESISSDKLANYQGKAQVQVLKKANDAEGQVAATLISAATDTPIQVNPPGVGQKLDIKA